MRVRFGAVGLVVLLTGLGLLRLVGQEALPNVPRGVEVLARGPIHEAFATLTAEAVPTKPVPRQPPAPIEEMPPEQKPDGKVIWLGGYWAWDEDRNDFLWVSGL